MFQCYSLKSSYPLLVKYLSISLEMPVQVQCTMLDAWGWCAGKAQGDGMGRVGGRRVQDGEHVIFLKLIKKRKKNNEGKKKKKYLSSN